MFHAEYTGVMISTVEFHCGMENSQWTMNVSLHSFVEDNSDGSSPEILIPILSPEHRPPLCHLSGYPPDYLLGYPISIQLSGAS